MLQMKKNDVSASFSQTKKQPKSLSVTQTNEIGIQPSARVTGVLCTKRMTKSLGFVVQLGL